jgi:hypothetical protein
MLGQNHFSEPNQHVLTFLHPILVCRITLSTSGVVLTLHSLSCSSKKLLTRLSKTEFSFWFFFFFGWGQDEQVFPKLRAVGAVQNAIAQELQSLRAHIKAAAPLIAMTMKPFYKPSPNTERKLAIKQKNFQFLPRDPPFEDENEYVVSIPSSKQNFASTKFS